MKTLDVNLYDVEELNSNEEVVISGGFAWLPFIVGAIAGGLTYDGLKAAYKSFLQECMDSAGEGVYEGMHWNWH